MERDAEIEQITTHVRLLETMVCNQWEWVGYVNSRPTSRRGPSASDRARLKEALEKLASLKTTLRGAQARLRELTGEAA